VKPKARLSVLVPLHFENVDGGRSATTKNGRARLPSFVDGESTLLCVREEALFQRTSKVARPSHQPNS
jgi:hypothetical protein